MQVKQSTFELLKILSMLFIVCHHLVVQNDFNIDTQLVGLNPSRLFLQLIGNHAFIANNLFFMTSAWFLSKKIVEIDLKDSGRRIWKLEKIMLFYSLGIPLVFIFSGGLGG